MLSKRALPLAALLFLAACATANGLRQGSPDLDEMSNKTPERTAGCIGDKLEASPMASRVRLSTRPTSTGYSISAAQSLPGLYGAGGTDTIILIDISANAGKTRVQLFTHFLTGDGGVSTLVRGCL